MTWGAIYVNILFICIGDYVNGQFCYPTKDAYATACAQNYGGVVNGGRCFFLVGYPNNSTKGTWAQAWSMCATQNAQFAHIHTSNEHTQIKNHYSLVWSADATGEMYVALQRDAGFVPSTAWRMDLTNTRWYDANGVPHPLLTVGNTWVRKHEKDDYSGNSTTNCYSWFGSMTVIGDTTCTSSNYVLCTVINLVQNYSLISGICMNEVVINNFTDPTVDYCANHCSSYQWCRSFNWYPATGHCDLFPWYYADTNNTVTKSGCYHYAYVP